ncbi:hypothetical protein ALC56_00821 [Trachymyrmex septentrionalis]|uniref:Uncharacterized protein n=1 Tax=Trachymyrmex septentrionalis TaxID=34720 RepID=A0A195FWM0_9HYME|nr:hypothetical protein ALC56_00821 [Trachymyrmex septentrionalis]
MGCERVDGATRGRMFVRISQLPRSISHLVSVNEVLHFLHCRKLLHYSDYTIRYTTCQALEKNEKKNTVRARRSNVVRRFAHISDSDRDQQFYLHSEIFVISVNKCECILSSCTDPRGPVPRSCYCRKIRFKFQSCTYRRPHINSSLLTGGVRSIGSLLLPYVLATRLKTRATLIQRASRRTEQPGGRRRIINHGLGRQRVLFCGVLDEVYFRKRKNGRTLVEGDILSRRRIIIVVTETKVGWHPKGTIESRNIMITIVISPAARSRKIGPPHERVHMRARCTRLPPSSVNARTDNRYSVTPTLAGDKGLNGRTELRNSEKSTRPKERTGDDDTFLRVSTVRNAKLVPSPSLTAKRCLLGNCRLRPTACPSASTVKAENRAVRDAVPEIYGSPDNEGDPAYSLRTVLCDSAANACNRLVERAVERNPGWSAFLNNRASETLDISSKQRASHAAKRLLATHEYNMGINKSKQAY